MRTPDPCARADPDAVPRRCWSSKTADGCKAFACSATDLWLLLLSWVRLLLIDIGLRSTSLPRVRRWMVPRSSRGKTVGNADSIERFARLVRIAARYHLYPMHCLQRSLALEAMLARHGITTQLRIGVRVVNGELGAHAWLEHEGHPVGEPFHPLQRFAPLEPLEIAT